MNRYRMEKLRDHLRDNVADERFYLATWAGNSETPWEGKQDLSCGTSACAMGHAVTIPEFRADGLALRPAPFNPGRGQLVFGNRFDFQAAADFMDISVMSAEWLFDHAEYPNRERTTKDEVVARMTKYLNSPIPIEDTGEVYDD